MNPSNYIYALGLGLVAAGCAIIFQAGEMQAHEDRKGIDSEVWDAAISRADNSKVGTLANVLRVGNRRIPARRPTRDNSNIQPVKGDDADSSTR